MSPRTFSPLAGLALGLLLDPACAEDTRIELDAISVTTDAGNRVTGLIADRQMVVSEAFGRAICDAAFGRRFRWAVY